MTSMRVGVQIQPQHADFEGMRRAWREAEEMGVVDNVVDAANTRAVFVWGPDRVRIEYVEHKPEFALK